MKVVMEYKLLITIYIVTYNTQHGRTMIQLLLAAERIHCLLSSAL